MQYMRARNDEGNRRGKLRGVINVVYIGVHKVVGGVRLQAVNANHAEMI